MKNHLSAVRTARVRCGAYELHCEEYGDAGAVPCVLMNGVLLDAGVNRELARRFAGEGYRVILLDLLGHGGSSKPADPAEHRIDFYAQHVLAVLDHYRMPRAMIGGVSLGAITALQVAVTAPQRVLALFLEMPVMEVSAPGAALLLVPLLMAARYTRNLYRPVARLIRRLPRPRFGPAASVMNALSQEPEVTAAILHGLFVGPIVPPVPAREAIRAPTLIIGHGRDWLHEYGDAQNLAEQIPGARLLTAESLLELRLRPERLWSEIQPFLESVRAGLQRPTRARRGKRR